MTDKVRETIEQFSMLRQGDRVTVAVSGGADSVALLDLLCSLADMHLDVRACHVNHCLRGAESDRDETLVRTMCREYGVPLDVRRVDAAALAKQLGLSIETAARQARYEFFESLALRDGSRIATAHSLSDTAETVVFNLARGTGIAGLCGIPQIRGSIIRPLLACSRAEIEEYCTRHGLYYTTDFTNFSDEYTRNFIRHQIMPRMLEINSGALEAVGRMTELLRRDGDYLQMQAREARARCAVTGGYSVQLLRREHPAIRSRIIAMLLNENAISRNTRRITRIECMLLDENPREISLKGRCVYAVIRNGVLSFERRENPSAANLAPRKLDKNSLQNLEISLETGENFIFSVGNRLDYEIFANNCNDPLKNAVDYDKIDGDVILRTREAGDSIRPAGRNCTKTLKKLHSELQLRDREHLFLLADAVGVFFAQHIGADERVRVCGATTRFLMIRRIKEIQ